MQSASFSFKKEREENRPGIYVDMHTVYLVRMMIPLSFIKRSKLVLVFLSRSKLKTNTSNRRVRAVLLLQPLLQLLSLDYAILGFIGELVRARALVPKKIFFINILYTLTI